MSLENKTNMIKVKKNDNIRGRKIKILFVFNSCKNRGPTRVILNIIKNLDYSKFDPFLLTFSDETDESNIEEFLPYISKHFFCRLNKIDIMMGRLGGLKEVLNNLKPDVIHSTGVFPDYAVSMVSANNQVVVMHNYAPVDYKIEFGRIRGSILTKMEYYASSRAVKTVACSKNLAGLYKLENLFLDYVQNGVDIGKFNVSRNKNKLRSKLGISKGKFIFIYTGHLSERKNVSFLIEIFVKIYKNNNNVELLLLGDGSDMAELCEKYTFVDNVVFIGKVSNVDEYLQASDVYVSASKSEGLPNGVLEAIACGLPVLLSNIPQHEEILESGDKCGYSFSLNDNMQLAQLMKKMVGNKELKTLSMGARKTAEKCFSSIGMSKKYQEIYENLVERRRITLFIGGLSGGGAERVTCNLANYLNENGYKVDVITMSNACDSYRLDKGINRINLLDKKERAGRIYNFRVRKKRLKEYVVKNQDVSCYIVMLPITIFMLVRLKRLTQSKMIISERNNPKSYKLYEKIIMKYAAGRCDGLVIQTKEIGKWYKNIENKVIIPNAINKDIVFPERGVVEKKIVSVSRLEKQKNIPMLIEGFAKFYEKHPDYTLEIYGKGSMENELRMIVEKHNLSDKIKFMGYVDNVAERIVGASCFILTSNYEGMPNALIEAMCIGVPCIATDCDGGGARELIKNDENGILIKKGDVDQLTNSIKRIASDEVYAKQISVESRKLCKKMSYKDIYNKWLEFIGSIIKQGT